MQQQKIVEEFIKARGWGEFYKPKELLLGLVEEIEEFRNIIKWEQDEEKVKAKISSRYQEVENFFGDMLWELCSLANYCKVDLSSALDKVIAEHSVRFPVDEVKNKHTNE